MFENIFIFYPICFIGPPHVQFVVSLIQPDLAIWVALARIEQNMGNDDIIFGKGQFIWQNMIHDGAFH